MKLHLVVLLFAFTQGAFAKCGKIEPEFILKNDKIIVEGIVESSNKSPGLLVAIFGKKEEFHHFNVKVRRIVGPTPKHEIVSFNYKWLRAKDGVNTFENGESVAIVVDKLVDDAAIVESSPCAPSFYDLDKASDVEEYRKLLLLLTSSS